MEIEFAYITCARAECHIIFAVPKTVEERQRDSRVARGCKPSSRVKWKSLFQQYCYTALLRRPALDTVPLKNGN
jgi:hypothetical protein